MSRKLKHTYYNYNFFIKTKNVFEKPLNTIIYNAIDDYINLDKKYNGLIKNDEIKKIDKDINIRVYGDGYKININIHIHNYVKVIFNFNDFINNLYNILNLSINNIILLDKKEIKENSKEIKEIKKNEKENVIQLINTKIEHNENIKQRFI
jgi:hypothetical protein